MGVDVAVPAAPPIPGLTFRHPTGPEDANALRIVHERRAAHDRVEPLSRMEDFPSREALSAELFEAWVTGTLDRWLIALVDSAVTGYSCFHTWPENDGTRVYLTLGWVLPEWRGQGIGTAMLGWTEARMRRQHESDHPGEKAELAANASDSEIEATVLLVASGYRAAYSLLALKLDGSVTRPACPLPAGLDLRPALPEHLPAIASCMEAAYREEYEGGRFDKSEGFEGCMAELSDPRHDPRLWRIAWDGDRVAGQVLPMPTPYGAEIYEVSVHPDWRRRGVARSLLTMALDDLHRRGIDTVLVHTVEEFRTHAKDLYASAGFRLLKRFPRYRKPW